MYPVPPHFQPRGEADLIDLVSRNPLAWLVASDLSAILLPIRPVVEEGGLVGLSGHMPRRIAGCFADDPNAVLLFGGPSAYLSPSWFADRRQAPTWSSASCAFRCTIRLIDDPAALRASLADLVDAMEEGRPHPWRLDEVGERYDQLAARIVAFRADIIDRRAAYRLGQDEDEQTFADIVAGLRAEGEESLAALMTDFRPSAAVRNDPPAAGTYPA